MDTASLLAETLGDDWAARAAGGGIAVHNPATDALITHVPRDGVAEAEKAHRGCGEERRHGTMRWTASTHG